LTQKPCFQDDNRTKSEGFDSSTEFRGQNSDELLAESPHVETENGEFFNAGGWNSVLTLDQDDIPASHLDSENIPSTSSTTQLPENISDATEKKCGSDAPIGDKVAESGCNVVPQDVPLRGRDITTHRPGGDYSLPKADMDTRDEEKITIYNKKEFAPSAKLESRNLHDAGDNIFNCEMKINEKEIRANKHINIEDTLDYYIQPYK